MFFGYFNTANEGEGSRSAARRYNAGVATTLRTGKVPEKAREAEEALEGPEGEELRRSYSICTGLDDN